MNNLKLIFASLKLNIKKEWQYKSSFFVQIIMMILNNLSFIAIFALLFSIADTIGGMKFQGMVTLFAISAGGFGFMHLFFNGATNLKDLIYNARLDVFMTQPKNLLLNICCSTTDISALGDILSGFVMLAIAGAPWWWYLAYLPLCIVSGLVYLGAYVFWHCFAFYLKGGDALANITEDIMLKASQYPQGIFNNTVKIVFATAVPVMLYTYIPVEHLLMDFNIWYALIYLGGAILWLTLAFGFFKISVRRYASGSVMGGRL